MKYAHGSKKTTLESDDLAICDGYPPIATVRVSPQPPLAFSLVFGITLRKTDAAEP
jgi:hypothetical protein